MSPHVKFADIKHFKHSPSMEVWTQIETVVLLSIWRLLGSKTFNLMLLQYELRNIVFDGDLYLVPNFLNCLLYLTTLHYVKTPNMIHPVFERD